MIVVYRTTSLTSAAGKRLRFSSRNPLLVPRSSTKFGDCSFSIAGILNGAAFPTMRRTYHLWRHLDRSTSSKPIFSYNRITDKLRGSPAWKHTFTQEDIQALWVSSMETHIHTVTLDIQAAVGVQHRNTHSHKRIYT